MDVADLRHNSPTNSKVDRKVQGRGKDSLAAKAMDRLMAKVKDRGRVRVRAKAEMPEGDVSARSALADTSPVAVPLLVNHSAGCTRLPWITATAP